MAEYPPTKAGVVRRFMELDDATFDVLLDAYALWGPHLFAGAVTAIAAARKVRADG